MRRVREITSKEENFRVEMVPGTGVGHIRRDSVKPEPEGTIILIPFRITGYDRDCDGGMMARLEALSLDGDTTGWKEDCIGLYHDIALVTSLEEIQGLIKGE